MSTIVSLTSWKPRFPIIIDAINSILSGSVLPDRIVLVIANDEYEYLPKEILELQYNGKIEILKYRDIGSHKKLLPVMTKYPNDDIITIDDDWVYGSTFVADLINYHKQYPNKVLCNWCLRISVDRNGRIKPYNSWNKVIYEGYSDIDLFPLSGAGALWPAHCFDKSKPNLAELEKCPNADDIYHKVLMIRNNILAQKIKCECHQSYMRYDIVSSTALASINVARGMNTAYIHNFGEYSDLCKSISSMDIPKVDNNVYGFSYKIKELKSSIDDELHTICADKFLMKEYCKTVLGTDEYNVPTLGVYRSIEDIPTDLSNVIIKCNHGSNMNRTFVDKIEFNSKALGILKKNLDTDYSAKFGETQYRNIDRKLIVEPLLNHVKDVKIYTAQGEILFIQYNDRENNKRYFFDHNGEYLPDLNFANTKSNDNNKCYISFSIENFLTKTRHIVEKISKQFNFVRVDFLVTDDKFYIGELTFTPFAGNRPFNKEYERMFGDKIFIPRRNEFKTEALLVTKYLNKQDLEEWLDWHINRICFEHVHIFDNNLSYDIRSVIEKYGNKVSCEAVLGIPRQYDLYNRYISYQSTSEWIMPIDDDEYLDFDIKRFKNVYEAIKYYELKIKDMKMLAIRWKHLFPKKFRTERTGKVLDYCTEPSGKYANLFGCGNKGIKCIVKRDSNIHYEETRENRSGGHIPIHYGNNKAFLFNGKQVYGCSCQPDISRNNEDERIRLLHCRYKGYSEYKKKMQEVVTVSDATPRKKHFKFDDILETLD